MDDERLGQVIDRIRQRAAEYGCFYEIARDDAERTIRVLDIVGKFNRGRPEKRVINDVEAAHYHLLKYEDSLRKADGQKWMFFHVQRGLEMALEVLTDSLKEKDCPGQMYFEFESDEEQTGPLESS